LIEYDTELRPYIESLSGQQRLLFDAAAAGEHNRREREAMERAREEQKEEGRHNVNAYHTDEDEVERRLRLARGERVED
jgi:hypothetical protein